MSFFIALLSVIAAYLIGSVNFAVVITEKLNKVDVRNYGSGNAGTTNVLRVAGPVAGALTFVLDAVKGVLAALLGFFVFRYLNTAYPDVSIFNPIYGEYLCGVVCCVGHCWPIFFSFKGGKAAATSLGVFSVCCPVAMGVGLILFIITMIITRTVSLGSLIGISIALITTVILNCFNIFGYGIYGGEQVNCLVIALFCIMQEFIVVYRHKENIKRIMNGTEKKLSVKRSK